MSPDRGELIRKVEPSRESIMSRPRMLWRGALETASGVGLMVIGPVAPLIGVVGFYLALDGLSRYAKGRSFATAMREEFFRLRKLA